ncbi:MAG: hypothetical protein OXC46_00875 [Thaumarchaeota archaeon]|nr:hypothetical protein [Nitrososphaerota archaeon]
MTFLDDDTINRIYPKRKCKTCGCYKLIAQMFRDKRGVVWKQCLLCRSKKAKAAMAIRAKSKPKPKKPKVKKVRAKKYKPRKQSPATQTLEEARQKVIALKGDCCFICARKEALTIHHCSYIKSDQRHLEFEKTIAGKTMYQRHLYRQVKTMPKRFLLVCSKCHYALERNLRWSPTNLVNMLAAIQITMYWRSDGCLDVNGNHQHIGIGQPNPLDIRPWWRRMSDEVEDN